ncbi:MAG: response regulator transcription factor [Pseudobutyrivibrio ruminis]|jgi:DNA-binding response OmpR family regulator|uniref:response regulator transcription factor n=1 Tax=Clostridium cochlearium TaxID=1494 RepID=UPI00280B0B7A|nr:response regulator transcription factor [Clostridium cochlearium]MBE5917351.1 response regulator transcription factor [Pseudobutyrivibrio ruminis]MDU1444000.1 response regulator transcription factor [Clostridium cochlearium]
MGEIINILVVEDDIDINNLLCTMLKKQGYNVKPAYSGTEAMLCLEHYDFQLVLLDLMLPGIVGQEIISQIRKIKNMPIIVISAKIEQDTKIEVLKLGADDFIVKPFDVNEVLARVEAQLRRYMIFSNKKDRQNILKYKDLTLNRDTIEVKIKDQAIFLTAREFAILELLMLYPNKVFTKANLYEKIWNDEFLGDDNTVNVHISNLRSKLAKVDPDTEYIRTVWGIGFKISE